MTSSTIGGGRGDSPTPAEYRCNIIVLFLHPSHAPPPVCSPHEHWRCRKPEGTAVTGTLAGRVGAMLWLLIANECARAERARGISVADVSSISALRVED